MAIQMRRGQLKDFDANKMLPGEFAVTIDEAVEDQKVFICFSAGTIKELATKEDFEADLKSIQQAIEDANNASKKAQDAIDKANQIVAGKVGIDDTQISTSTVYSSQKSDEIYVKKTDYDNLVKKVETLVDDLSDAIVSR
jgi:hypothetical protein|nr:MAG TPA: hypothetical protein [Caudoviricetes sp.]